MADIKTKYGASAAFSITLASLATSSSLTAGRESTAIANTSTLALDYLVGGFITTGTSPTVSTTIQVWVYAAFNDTPSYPDVFDGTDSDETITSENVRNGALALAALITVDGTSNRRYDVKPFSVAALFGGICPTHFGLFVTHNTGVALNSTGGNHALYYTPILAQTV